MNDTLNGLPRWAKTVATIGFPIVVAMFLLGAVTGVLPSALSKEHTDITTRQEQVRKDLAEQDKSRTEAAKEQMSLLRLICANTAKSEAVALECLRNR